MPIALHPKETRDYRLEAEREKDGATIFVLGFIPDWKMAPLTRAAAEAFRPMAEGERIEDYPGCIEIPGEAGSPRHRFDAVRQHELIPSVLRAGLRGWRGFRFADGSEAKFEINADGEPTEATLGILGRDGAAAMELMNEIFRMNRLSGREAGN